MLLKSCDVDKSSNKMGASAISEASVLSFSPLSCEGLNELSWLEIFSLEIRARSTEAASWDACCDLRIEGRRELH